jgi:hypothetical protein
MSFLLRKVVAAVDLNACKEWAWRTASSVVNRFSRGVVEQTFFEVLSVCAGNPVATAVQITFPYIGRVKEVAVDVLNGDGDLVQECFQEHFKKSQKKFMRSVTVVLNSSPNDLAVLYIGNKMKKDTLKSICALLSRLTKANIGQTLFVATAPVVAPSVLPIAFSAATAFRLAAAAALPNENQEVELDDFKEFAEWVHVENEDI